MQVVNKPGGNGLLGATVDATWYDSTEGAWFTMTTTTITDGLGNWREVNEAGPKYQAVTAEDVKRVEAALEVVGSSDRLAVDANAAFCDDL